jgi:uncharacterized membrane protein YphA (DoxX/SURF4 family)
MKGLSDFTTTMWNKLFATERPQALEVLLWFLLAKAVRDGLVAATVTSAAFHQAPAFSEVAIDIDGVGWAEMMSDDMLKSVYVYRGLGLITSVSCMMWLLKVMLPYSSILGTLSFGLLTSQSMSLAYSYLHETLPAVACLLVICACYVFRRQQIAASLREGVFWSQSIYPKWPTFLICVYMGVSYTYSGLTKLVMGGEDAFSGLTLQLLFGRTEDLPLLAQPIVNSRLVATAVMTATVILETGALPALLVPCLRKWWCLGLVGMHLSVLFAMNIPFKVNIVVLLWMAFVAGAKFDWLSDVIGRSGVTKRLRTWMAAVRNPAFRRLAHSLDILGLLSPQT